MSDEHPQKQQKHKAFVKVISLYNQERQQSLVILITQEKII